jgi:hypothetical protein
MRPPTTMRAVSGHELGFNEKQRPLYEINADVEDSKAAKRISEILSAVPTLRPLAADLKEKGYPPAAILEVLLKQR